MNTKLTASASDLNALVGVAKAKDVPDDALVPLLRQNDWSERRVYRALSEYYGNAAGMAPPSSSDPTENARDGFASRESLII